MLHRTTLYRPVHACMFAWSERERVRFFVHASKCDDDMTRAVLTDPMGGRHLHAANDVFRRLPCEASCMQVHPRAVSSERVRTVLVLVRTFRRCCLLHAD